jgi:ATP-binding cassette, subfamily B, bacterial PglK
MLNTLKDAFSLLTRRERWQLLGLLCLTVLMGLVQMIGVGSIMPFMAIVAQPERVTTNRWFAPVYDFLGFTSTHDFLLFAGFVVLAIMTFGNALKAFTSWCVLRFSSEMNYSLSVRLLEQYLSEPYEFFLNRNTSKLAKNILSEVREVVNGVITPALNMVAHGAVSLAILGLLLIVNPAIAVTAAGVFGGAFGIVYVLVRRKQLRLGKLRNRMASARFRVSLEALSGIKETKVLGREREFLARFSGPAKKYSEVNASNAAISDLPKYALETLAFGGIVVLVLYMLGTDGAVGQALPMLSLYALASYRLMPSLQQIFRALGKIRFFTPALASLRNDLSRAGRTQGLTGASEEAAAIDFRHEIAIDDVWFRYPGQEEYVARGIDLRIPKDSSVGFVGSTGSGKTTLVDVILGLFEPERGHVRVDDVALAPENVVAWRRRVGYVPQYIFLCDDTIANNVAFGLAAAQIDRVAVEQAARIANLHDFVMSLPDGYDTVVGDRGVRLSGGQRQRIGIARALYHDPDVLVMDEATSALDGITETAVMAAIERLAGRKTIILVAHRLSTVQRCDRIFLFDRGEIVATGTYEELLRDNLQFQKMARGGRVPAAALPRA